jgi:hypothetical protein
MDRAAPTILITVRMIAALAAEDPDRQFQVFSHMANHPEVRKIIKRKED